MIEVNLLPGGKKRASRRPRMAISLPEISGLPTDRWVLGSAAVVVVLLVATVVLFLSRSSTYGELEANVAEAAADSARYADLIEQAEQLRARRDSIAERVSIIQEIDRERYIWPHVLDEVARALPDYTWLTNLTQVSLAEDLQLRLQGMAGNNFALTTFMENLEASPYIRGVTLVNTQLTVQSVDGVSSSVNQFQLEAVYEEPAMELRQTVPLFEEGGAPPVGSQARRDPPPTAGPSGLGPPSGAAPVEGPVAGR